MKSSFSSGWKRSVQPRKQRKFRANAPLHVRKDFLSVHLSPELRKKHGMRNVILRKGDKVKILRGQFKKKEGKVDRVSLKREKVFVTGIEYVKGEGVTIPAPLSPSNLMIMDLDVSDKKRKIKK